MKREVEIWKPLCGDVEIVRKTFRTRMEKLYDGWDDGYDSQWDGHSFLFVLKQEKESAGGITMKDDNGQDQLLAATCRLVVKRYEGITFATPMEKADLSNYVINESYGNCCEGSMLSYSSVESLKVLASYVFNWLIENGFDYITSCYDENNPLMERLYLNSFGFDKVPGAVVKYSGFYSKKTCGLVGWQVIKENVKKQMPSIVQSLAAETGELYPKNTFPSVKEFLQEKSEQVFVNV